ncbi:unnamed protein product [Hymenolepis diminuta]|uniref:Solute carrier family 25 member 46 n=1 Tax=Hymenolepis diminuta TaxID=6216 RepID=A0A564YSL3_HYMDI|nr:unnamed protein product [Hymenolepis diminuta]
MWSHKLKEMEKNAGVLPQEEDDAVPIPESHSLPQNEPNVPSSDISIKEMLGYGVNASSIFTEIAFAHPFLVLRHQCQVRGRSKILHLTPLSLLPILRTYISRQGVISLWKGLSGAITVKIIRIVSENTLSEALSLPKDITSYSSPSKIFFHILLKILSWMIATPFYAASMVEFVQSDIASEPTTLISCFLEGMKRLLPNISPTGPRMGSVGGNLKADLRAIPIRTSRLLPIWRLVLPVTLLGVGHHVIRSFINFGVSAYLRRDQEPEQLDAEVMGIGVNANTSRTDQALLTSHRRDAMLQTTCSLFFTDLSADMISCLAADAIVYPLETVVVRLCVQGTRTLVDNLDSGDSVVPIISSFNGIFDVLRSASTSSSGFLGLYRGFGSLVLQYAVQIGLLVGVKYAYEHILYMYSSNNPVVLQHSQPNSLPSAGMVGRSSIPPTGEYGTTSTDYGSTSFYSSAAPKMFENQSVPTVSTVWQPTQDSERWRSSDSNLKPGGGDSGQNSLTRNAFAFRGFDPDTFNQPM